MGNILPSNIIAAASQMDPISMEDLIAMHTKWKEGDGENIGILRSVSGISSTISSSTLIWMIARSHKGLSTTQHRILLGLSICDLISSLGYSTFSSIAPSDNNYFVWNARGNEATCDAQGFLLGFGVFGGLFYNATLCLYYVAVVNKGKGEDYIRTKIEPFLHGIPTVLGLAYSIAFLAGNHLNDAGGGGCIAPFHYPPHCQGYDVGDVRDGFEIPCGRGIEGADTFMILQMMGLFIPATIIIASLSTIYRGVKKQENKLSRYSVRALNLNSSSLWKRMKTNLRQSSSSTNTHPAMRSNNMQSESRAIMHRAFQYSAAWFLSYGTYTLVVITKRQIVFLYLSNIFTPLQGFFNVCIYMYPKVISARKPKRGQDKKVSWYQAISMAFWSRGKENKRNCPRPQTSNLRDGRNNHPLRSIMKKYTNVDARMVKPPHFFRHKNKSAKDEKIHDRRERQEEEEKCEIQPPSNMLVSDRHSKVSQMIYTPNITYPGPVTVIHSEIDSTVQDVGEGTAASETSDHEGTPSEAFVSGEGDGKEEFSTGLDDNIKQYESSSSIGEDFSTECNDAAITTSFVKNETEMKI